MNPKKISKNAKEHSLYDIQSMIACFEDDVLPNIPSKAAILHRAKQRQLKKKVLGTSVFTLCSMLLGLYWYNPAYQQQYFMTQRGEQKNIQLGDGSHIKLNTDTDVRVKERLRSREILLNKGEASFHVAHAENKFLRHFERIFQVTAGDMLIIDIGTVFNVQKHSNSNATVTVLEGEVAVSILNHKNTMIHLTEGQSLSNQKLNFLKPVHVNLDRVQAWQKGHIVFDQTPLSTALKDFQRYADFTVQLQDIGPKDILINGQFKTHSYQSFIQALPYVASVRIEKISEQNWKIVKK